MNVKHIFAFVICVVLPNGLFSRSLIFEEQQYYDQMVKTWTTMNIKDSPVQLDDNGNIILKVIVCTGAKRNAIYVSNMDRIGVKLKALPIKNRANNELIEYLAKVLEIRKSAIQILNGLKYRTKILKISKSSRTVKDLGINADLKTVQVEGNDITFNEVLIKLEQEFDGSAMIGEPGYLKLNAKTSAS